jgi:hypothetical protein
MITATNTMFTHIFHFTNNEEMSYCLSHLDCYVKPVQAEEHEFDGHALYEVIFTTVKQISKATIAKMVKHFDPKDYKFNQS